MNDYTFQISPYVLRRDTTRFNTLRSNPSVASLISFRIVSEFLRHSVSFDRESSSFAEKVEHEWSERMLPPEL